MTEMYKLARPKLRGVPFQISGGQLNKEIKSHMAREILSGLPSFKGEIVVGSPQALDCFERSTAFAEEEGSIQLFVAWVYDLQTTERFDLRKRLNIAESFIQACGFNIQFVDHTLVENQADLDRYAKLVIEERGFPGVILREPFGTFNTEDEELAEATIA